MAHDTGEYHHLSFDHPSQMILPFMQIHPVSFISFLLGPKYFLSTLFANIFKLSLR